jgi:hypothetical protein
MSFIGGVIGWFKSWSSDVYSDKEIKSLEKIRALYIEELGSVVPGILTLTEENKPTGNYSKADILAAQNGRVFANRGATGNFFAYPQYFIGTIHDYLKEKHQRYFGAGRKGDILTLVFLELKEWAEKELPKLSYDKNTLVQLQKRKNYLTRLIQEDFFSHGMFQRRITKFNALIKLNIILDGFIAICEGEMKRESIRENLSKCRESCVGILRKSLDICYYSCDVDARENTFVPEIYVNQSTRHVSIKEREIYNRISKSENGEILKVISILSGLSIPGFPIFENITNTSKYYDDKFDPIYLDWTNSSQVYPWQNGKHSIIAFQRLGAVILKLTDVLRILDLSRDIVSGLGDYWVSQPAKMDFLELLKELELSLQVLKIEFSSFLQCHDDPRTNYNQEMRINGDKGWNPSFTIMKNLLGNVEESIKSVTGFIDNMREIIKDYPIRSVELGAKEIVFVNQMRRRKGLEPIVVHPAQDPNHPSPNHQSNFQVDSVEELKFTISKSTDCFIFMATPDLLKNSIKKPDSFYDNWAHNFLTHHQDLLLAHNQIIADLQLAIKNNDTPNIKLLDIALQANLADLISNLQAEKPQWRFKYFVIPVSLGWPFHRKAGKFAELLTNELVNKLAQSIQTIQRYSEISSSFANSNNDINRALDNQASIISINITRGQNFVDSMLDLLTSNKQQSPRSDVGIESKHSANTECKSEPVITLTTWRREVHAAYFAWVENENNASFEFFPAKEITESTLNRLIELLNSADVQKREIFISSIFSLYQDINSSICDIEPNTSKNIESLEQLKLLSKFLKVMMDSQTVDINQSIGEFMVVVKRTFDSKKARIAQCHNYSSQGLLRPPNIPKNDDTGSSNVSVSLSNNNRG